MFTAPRWLLGYLAGSLAAAFMLIAGIAAPAVRGSDSIDQIITGSIGPGTTPPAGPAEGSAEFRAALDVLTGGDAAGAYALAQGFKNVTERRAVQWGAIYSSSGDLPYDAIVRFAADAPEFARMGVFKTRLEQALTKGKAGSSEIIKYLSGAMPNTLDAQIALALAYVDDGQKERGARIARDIWVNDILDQASEEKVLGKLGTLLTKDDHWARAEHLMMHDRATAVERLLPQLTAGQRTLAVARNAVSRNAKDAKQLLDAVDPAYQGNPIYLFSRAQRARQFQLWDDAIAYLNKGKANAPDAEEWWYERRTLVRQLLGIGDAQRAYAAAAGYTDGPEGRVVEAQFHAGWIALSFLDSPRLAAKHFEAMAKLSTLPDSVTQAQYWLGRTRDKLGDKAGAKQAYTAAAKYGTIYYGLLARTALGLKAVELRDLPAAQDSETSFESDEIVRAIRLLSANGQDRLALPLLRSFSQGLKDGPDLLLAARLAQTINAHHLAIAIADTADKRGTPLDLFSFPKDGLPSTQLAQIDKAAIYAIARQESKFQIDAVSRSGARGLMQLMPATAKETAKKAGVAYSQNRLTTDGAYNALLGSTYLANQLSSFDNSLVLAAVAYNAGAGNARKWIAAYGDPRADNVDPVIWVELIPFEETRQYVRRVLGNYLVYRARLGYDDMTLAQALRHIAG